MDAEKLFWAMVVLVVAGFTLFITFGGLVQPVNASPQGGTSQQQVAAQVPAPSGGQLAPVNGGVQEITLSVQGGTYQPNPIRVKKGIPVRLVADISAMPGCSKSIVMPDFGVRKVVRQGDNIIEFTPSQSGKFSFSCSMGMYRGTIVVEDTDGTVAAFTGTAPKASGGSCGVGGGCGCGG